MLSLIMLRGNMVFLSINPVLFFAPHLMHPRWTTRYISHNSVELEWTENGTNMSCCAGHHMFLSCLIKMYRHHSHQRDFDHWFSSLEYNCSPGAFNVYLMTYACNSSSTLNNVLILCYCRLQDKCHDIRWPCPRQPRIYTRKGGGWRQKLIE